MKLLGTGPFAFGNAGTFLLTAPAASVFEGFLGRELWQPYLDAAPQSAEAFSKDPLHAFLALLPDDPLELLRQTAHSYSAVLLFLLVLAVVSFLMGDSADSDLLELVSAAGCGVLLWSRLADLAQTLCEKMTGWRTFLLGFLPVYGGVLTAGGETSAGAASCGLLLSGLCLLAQCAALWVSPLLQIYLAISMACCIGTQKGLAAGCRMTGTLLRKGLNWAGRIFAVLLGLQRVVTLQLDRMTLQVGQLLTGSVPVIGDVLSGVTETVLVGMRLLKSAVGLAGLAVIGGEFLPLYCTLMLHLLFLQFCMLLCDFTESRRCHALLSCLAEAVRCMAAVTALFFEMMLVGVSLLMIAGGG